jgi:salicylate hydroxylase
VDSAIIIGAGIGGLSAALALAAHGAQVEVYEQATQVREVGAGLTLSLGSLRALELLEVLAEVEAVSCPCPRMPFLHYRSGMLLWGSQDQFETADPPVRYTPRHIYRADLQRLLAETLERRCPGALRLGRRLISMEQDHSGVVARFADGSLARGSLLIGADGLKSQARGTLWGAQQAIYTNQVAWRFIVEGALARPYLGAGRAALFLGPGQVFNRYTLRNGQLLNCVAIVRTPDWREEGWSIPGDRDELCALFADWHPDVSALMHLADPRRLIRWAIFERGALARWRQGRVTLLGDAAHPMQPFLGLGAAMAIEDACILGRAMTVASDPLEALDRYEKARLARTTEVAEASRLQGRLLQGTDPDQFSGDLAPVGNGALFEYDPMEVAV